MYYKKVKTLEKNFRKKIASLRLDLVNPHKHWIKLKARDGTRTRGLDLGKVFRSDETVSHIKQSPVFTAFLVIR